MIESHKNAMQAQLRSKNLDPNIVALKIKLTETDLKEIYDVAPTTNIAGERTYSSFLACSWKNADTPRMQETQDLRLWFGSPV